MTPERIQTKMADVKPRNARTPRVGGRRLLATALLASALAWPALCAEQPGDNVQQAISLAVAAEYEAALELFKAELLQNPDSPLLNYYVGMTEFKLERFSAAIARFQKAVDEEAPFPQAYYWLTLACLEKERDEDAAKTLREGLLRFPRNPDLLSLADKLEKELPPPSQPPGQGPESEVRLQQSGGPARRSGGGWTAVPALEKGNRVRRPSGRLSGSGLGSESG